MLLRDVITDIIDMFMEAANVRVIGDQTDENTKDYQIQRLRRLRERKNKKQFVMY